MAFIQLGVIASPGSESWLNVDGTQFTKDEATDSLQIKPGAVSASTDNVTIQTNGLSQLYVSANDITDGITTDNTAGNTIKVLNSGLPFSQQNYIINPSFQIALEKTTYTDASSTSFNTLDGWGFLRVQSLGRVTIAQTASTTSASGFCHKITVTTTEATTENQAHISFYTIVEGYNSVQLKNGTGLLSFFAKSSKAGIYCVTAMNVNSLYTYIKEYTLAANVRTEINVEFPFSAETAGIWNKTNGNGIVIRWFLKCGVDYQSSPNVWAHVDGYATSNQVNFYDAANTFEIEDVRLVQGTIANYQAIQLKSFGDELSRCLRYYEKSYEYAIIPGSASVLGFSQRIAYNAYVFYDAMQCVTVRKRITPVYHTYSIVTGAVDRVYDASSASDIIIVIGDISENNFTVSLSNNGTLSHMYQYQWTANARMII